MYDWSRFSKGGRDDAPEGPLQGDALEGPPGAGAATRMQMADANVTITNRPTASPASPGAMPLPVGPREEVETVVGHESSIQGTIRSEHSIRIQGTAQGEIESKHAVYVEEGSRVSAKITAAEITISGQVDGQVFSTGRVSYSSGFLGKR